MFPSVQRGQVLPMQGEVQVWQHHGLVTGKLLILGISNNILHCRGVGRQHDIYTGSIPFEEVLRSWGVGSGGVFSVGIPGFRGDQG